MFTFSFRKKRQINKIKYQGFKKNNFEYCSFNVDNIYDWCDSDSNSRLKLNSKFNKKINNKLVLNQIINKNNLNSFIPKTTIIKDGIIENHHFFFEDNDNEFYFLKHPKIEKGKGIYILNRQDLIQKSKKNSKVKYILQKNIPNLLLYKNKKFDIRIYLVVEINSGDIKFKIYNEGIIRINPELYDKNNIQSFLTNTSVGLKKI